MKEKWNALIDKMIKNGKIVFPIAICLAFAVTVVIALQMGGAREKELEIIGETISTEPSETSTEETTEKKETPLTQNTDEKVEEIVNTYYQAVADGDVDTLVRICDRVEDLDMLKFKEASKYVEYLPVLGIYTLPGYEEGDVVTCVCFKTKLTGKDGEYPGYQMLYLSTAEDGSYYVRRAALPQNINDYLNTLGKQADLVDFINRVQVEYDQFMEENPELLAYLNDVNTEVNRVVGMKLAKMEEEAKSSEENPDENPESQEGGESQTNEPGEPVQEIIYATATATVNVRKSDSEKAEKLGKVARGTKIKVYEQQVNGWSKIEFEGQEAFIMSRFLKVKENALQYTAIGTVKATSNINVREDASTDAAKLGTMVEGQTAELIAEENGWCKIIFDEQVAYVKAEYVERVSNT